MRNQDGSREIEAIRRFQRGDTRFETPGEVVARHAVVERNEPREENLIRRNPVSLKQRRNVIEAIQIGHAIPVNQQDCVRDHTSVHQNTPFSRDLVTVRFYAGARRFR